MKKTTTFIVARKGLGKAYQMAKTKSDDFVDGWEEGYKIGYDNGEHDGYNAGFSKGFNYAVELLKKEKEREKWNGLKKESKRTNKL